MATPVPGTEEGAGDRGEQAGAVAGALVGGHRAAVLHARQALQGGLDDLT